MAHRWTIQELEESTDNEILRILVRERHASLTNYYTPLARRLQVIGERLDKQVFREQQRRVARRTKSD